MAIHQGQPVIARGTALDKATAAMIMIHGRGSDPEGILAITSHLVGKEVAYLAPAANRHQWYPQRFLAPKRQNQPYLDSALAAVNDVVQHVVQIGIPTEKIVLLGFSQGACLALEYSARHIRRYGGVVALSGGLIGDDSELVGYEGDFANTPIFLGCSDVDMHIPVQRVHRSADILAGLGANVTTQIYPNFGHTINMDEIEHVNGVLRGV
jgi:predicted esterase